MISVVMPAHNEESLLVTAVGAVAEGMGRRGPYEILVIENGSVDATPTLAAGLAEQVPGVRAMSLPEADYGRALRTGLLAAQGATVVIFDVDYYDFDFLDRALELVAQPAGPVVVVATKRGLGAVDTRAWPRRFVTTAFSTLLRVGFGLGVSDTHGMKVLRRAPVLALVEACRFGTDLFDTELVLRVERAGLRVGELPVTVAELRPSRTSIARRIPRTLLGLARLRLALWQEKPMVTSRA